MGRSACHLQNVVFVIKHFKYKNKLQRIEQKHIKGGVLTSSSISGKKNPLFSIVILATASRKESCLTFEQFGLYAKQCKIITGRNEVVAKVMFLQVCVCPQGGRVSASVHAGMPYPPGWRTPPGMENPPDGEPAPDGEAPPDGEPQPPSGKQTPAYGL